jgi:hypothetical protein
MNRLFVVLVLALVSGCAFSTLNKGLPYLTGEHIDAAVNVLGLPNQQMQVGSYTVYVWDNRYSSTIPIYNTTTSTTTGMVGTVPVYGTTTTGTMNYVPVQYQCQIKLQVDSNNIVQRWEYFGNQGGCKYYANRVKRLIRD